MLENAREVFASSLGVRGDEVTFTPSGTHAVHLGVLGLLAGRARPSKILARSAVEHPSVVHAGDCHAARGGEVCELPVDLTGRGKIGRASGRERVCQYGFTSVVGAR